MTNAACPHCGTPVAGQARFCGQCGQTIPEASPAPRPKTSLLGQTMLDPSPLGAQVGAATEAAPPIHKDLAKTMNDPDAEARARAIRDAVLAQTETQKPITTRPPPAPAPTPAPAPAPTPDRSALGKTMVLGGSMPEATPSPAMPAPEASPLSRSVMAPKSWAPPPMPDAAPTPAPEPAPAAAPSPASAAAIPVAAKTMLGMPATELPRAQPHAPAAPQPGPQPQPSPGAHLPPAQKTMLGVAIPGIAPTGVNATPNASAPAPQPHAPLPLPSRQGTMMGVAVPGIAPTGAGASPPAPHASPAPRQPSPHETGLGWQPPPVVPAPPPLVEEPLPATPRAPEKRGVPALALVGVLIVVVCVLGAVGAYFALRGGGVLTAQPRLDESGKESLQIGCPTCPDGTIVSLGASTAQVQAAAALLPLPAPLSIGDNDLVVRIDRPGAGRDEDVKVHVPVAYRVRADLTSLTARPPAITVRVEALPGTTAEVDGKPLALDASGSGAYVIDLGSETDGPSDDQKTFERKIPFSITPKGGVAETGELRARTAIVPVHLDAPGLFLVTDKPTAPVSGQTRTGASVTVDGAAAAVDDKGRFGVRVELPASGEKQLEIVASSPPLAPRIVRAKVLRAASLEAAAKELAAEGPVAFDTFATNATASHGKKAVVEGEIIEARVAQGHSVLLVDEKKACAKGASCLVRVDHGEEAKVARGDVVRVFGRFTGTVPWSGKSVPSVDAALVLVVQPGKGGAP